ncbi:MAG: inositol monophosphatase family protein [Gemmatimonadota bacterium]
MATSVDSPILLPLRDRRRFYGAALALAKLSRRVILRRQASGFRKRLKADASYVTDADLEVERVLRREITRRFPEHGIIGEEFPAVNAGAPFQWILDPIDGTLSFTHGIPFFGTIIGLHHHGVPIVGVIDHAALGLCYSAGLGLGSWRNGKRIRIRDLAPGDVLEREVISAGDRSRFVQCRSGGAFDRLLRIHANVRGYSDCLGHTLAAEGKVGATLDYGLKLWDLAATRLLVEEAGGKYVVTYETAGEPVPIYGIIFGKPRVVDWLIPQFVGSRRR